MSSGSDNSLASIGVNAGIPSLNVADIPANVRNGNAAAQQAYTEGLAFEQVLVNELTTQLANTMGSGTLDPTSDGSDSSDSGSSSGGLLGGSSASAYSSLIPQALSSSIMSGGGLGMAEQFAAAIDPSLNDPASSASGEGTSTELNSDSTGSVSA
jgi:hypothetical protein